MTASGKWREPSPTSKRLLRLHPNTSPRPSNTGRWTALTGARGWSADRSLAVPVAFCWGHEAVSVLPTIRQLLPPSEFVSQRELHHARLGQQARVGSETVRRLGNRSQQ